MISYKNFTIVVCTYNRAKLLDNTLRLLVNINYPRRKFEIFVIDNNSSDETKNVIKKWEKKSNGIVKYLFEPRQGISYASNHALLKSRSEYLVFIDDDERVKPDLLRKYNESWDKHKNKYLAIIGGKIIPYFENNEAKRSFKKYSTSIGEWVFGLFDLGRNIQLLTFPNSVLAGNFSMKRELIYQLGGFDENLGINSKNGYIHGDDIELCCRVLKLGLQIVYDPTIVVSNFVPESRFNRKYIIKRYWMSGVEQHYMDLKLRGENYIIHNSKRLLTKTIRDLLLLPFIKGTFQNILTSVQSISYVTQTIPAIRKRLSANFQNILP